MENAGIGPASSPRPCYLGSMCRMQSLMKDSLVQRVLADVRSGSAHPKGPAKRG